MKYKELAGMGEQERKKKQKEIEMELIKLNAQVSTGTPPKNPGQIKQLKKMIAKIKTIEKNQEVQLKQK